MIRIIEIILGISIIIVSPLQFLYVLGIPPSQLITKNIQISTFVSDWLYDTYPIVFAIVMTFSLLFFIFGMFSGAVLISGGFKKFIDYIMI